MSTIKLSILFGFAILFAGCITPSEPPVSNTGNASTNEVLNVYGTLFGNVDLDLVNNSCSISTASSVVNNAIFPYGHLVAVNTQLLADGATCGECYKIECVDKVEAWADCSCDPGTSVVAMVADFGHDLANPSFDIQPNTADIIMSCNIYNDGAKYNFKATRVPCEHQGDISLLNEGGITSEWLSYSLSEVAGQGGIEEFFFREAGRTDYYPCHRNTNGAQITWVCDPWTDDRDAYLASGAPLGLSEGPYRLPIDIKIIDDAGNEIETLDVATNFTQNSVFLIPNFNYSTE